MSNRFVGEILLLPFNFAPTGFALCNGQLMPISLNKALFSLLGTQYGGDGKSTFALPNLNGRVPIGQGQGPGLSDRALGESTGSETVALTVNEMPAHTHGLTVTALSATPQCRNAPGNQQTPVSNVPAIESAGVTATYSDAAPNNTMNGTNATVLSGATVPQGASQGHQNMQPYLALNYCIALQGVFPPRS